MDYSKYTISLSDAKAMVDEWDSLPSSQLTEMIHQWSVFNIPSSEMATEYTALRTALVDEFNSALIDTDYRIGYYLDLKVGIKLFESLNTDNGFTLVCANNDDIWRYLTLKVFPDLTFIRYPNRTGDIDTIKEIIPKLTYANASREEKGSVHFKTKRFYSHTRRIWLKTLWWYVYLGWQGSSDTTYEVLKNNGTNIISHFIERPGKGYRESLFREMLLAYSELSKQSDAIFRAAAKLNLAKCISVEPALTTGGEAAYSKKLFEEVSSKRVEDVRTSNS